MAKSATSARAKKKNGSATRRPAAAKEKATAPRKAKAAKAAARRKKSTTSKSAPPLGRPKVTGEELLFMLFHDDFHARQIFDFLRVKQVKELEQFSPQQIFKLLSRPITETVNRIRRKLADKNRHLLEDLDFAVEHQQGAAE